MSRKTLKDFPTFRLSRLSGGETDPDGFTTFELEGEFDRFIKPVREITWFWPLIGEREAVCAQWKFFADDARAATLVVYAKELPERVGKTLHHLSPDWEPVNVWMVLDEQLGVGACVLSSCRRRRRTIRSKRRLNS